MAMIKCPECGRQISDKAPVCPNCGVEIAGKIIKCPECGEIYFRDEEMCPNCHHLTRLSGTVGRSRSYSAVSCSAISTSSANFFPAICSSAISCFSTAIRSSTPSRSAAGCASVVNSAASSAHAGASYAAEKANSSCNR